MQHPITQPPLGNDHQSKYNYIVRSNSIVNCAFNPKKLDLLETTDKMAEDVLNVYLIIEIIVGIKKSVIAIKMKTQ